MFMIRATRGDLAHIQGLWKKQETWDKIEKTMGELKATLPASDDLPKDQLAQLEAIHKCAESQKFPTKDIDVDHAY